MEKEKFFINYFGKNKLDAIFEDMEFALRNGSLFLKKFYKKSIPSLSVKIEVPVANHHRIKWDKKEVFIDSSLNAKTQKSIEELMNVGETVLRIANKYKIMELKNHYPDNSMRFLSTNNRFLYFLPEKVIPQTTLVSTHEIKRIDQNWLIFIPKK